MNPLWCYIIASTLIAIKSSSELIQNNNTQVEIRAVMVMCEVNENLKQYVDGQTIRFQREELFKHNAIEDCKQKLAVTVKISSDKFSGDEFIPIEHVMGADKKRIRLYNPYVLRLQRRSPFQSFKLKRMDIVSGVMVNSFEDINTPWTNFKDPRQRDVKPLKQGNQYVTSSLYCTNLLHDDHTPNQFESYDNGVNKKTKRRAPHATINQAIHAVPLDDDYVVDDEATEKKSSQDSEYELPYMDTTPIVFELRSSNKTSNNHNPNEELKIKELFNSHTYRKKSNDEHKLALYEIQHPELLCGVHLQLFEKTFTPQGKSLWNDLTKEETARVSTKNSKWSNGDISIKYKPVEYQIGNGFSLPLQNLCLVIPVTVSDDISQDDMFRNFFIVPMEDIINLTEIGDSNTEKYNDIEANTDNNSFQQKYRRVAVRMKRTLMCDHSDLNIYLQGSEKYLRMPYLRPHSAQLDIEARADDNELVLVGAFGRLMTIVSDTRETRAVVTVQATNTGLASSNFSVLIRDCTPASVDMNAERYEDVLVGPSLLPPRQTKSYCIDIPFEIPIETLQCAVTLVNEHGESVAVRDVRIKRNDQCFCVWYCNCVCLSEDPKLLCRSLSEAQIVVAGLPLQDRLRHVRSVCYPDIVTINIVVTIVGVLLALLLLGIVKACLGLILRCVGSWGLHFILQTPRKLERYYECSLRDKRVVYDKEGWPVHPDTKQRTVRLISKAMEFILNILFFIILPCAIIWDAIRKLALRCQVPERKTEKKYRNEHKKCFSSHDAQSFEPLPSDRQGGLRKWMTPQAEELTNKILHKALTPDGSNQPLLQEKQHHNIIDKTSHMDSEQDDTDYVLMQMRMSKESLARNQRKYETKSGRETHADNKER